MMGEEIECRPEVIEYMKDAREEMFNSGLTPETKYLGWDNRSFSLNDLIREVESQTRFGMTVYETWENMYDQDHPKSINS